MGKDGRTSFAANKLACVGVESFSFLGFCCFAHLQPCHAMPPNFKVSLACLLLGQFLAHVKLGIMVSLVLSPIGLCNPTLSSTHLSGLFVLIDLSLI
jgi:hypothetical protein